MTVQAGIELDLDISELVGEMPVVPCEHHQHAKLPSQHEGPASHYIDSCCPECKSVGGIRAVCQRFVDHSRHAILHCPSCNAFVDGAKAIRVLSPITK